MCDGAGGGDWSWPELLFPDNPVQILAGSTQLLQSTREVLAAFAVAILSLARYRVPKKKMPDSEF